MFVVLVWVGAVASGFYCGGGRGWWRGDAWKTLDIGWGCRDGWDGSGDDGGSGGVEGYGAGGAVCNGVMWRRLKDLVVVERVKGWALNQAYNGTSI